MHCCGVHSPRWKRSEKMMRAARCIRQNSMPTLFSGVAGKPTIPEQHLPVERPALGPERRAERAAVRVVARGHERLEVVAGDQLVVHGGAREVDVVAAHAHQLVVVIHRVGGEGDADHLAAGEERVHLLALGRHHLHPPDFLRERRDGDEVVLLDVVFGLARQIADQVGLLARARRAASSPSRAPPSSRRRSPSRAPPSSSRASHQANSRSPMRQELLGRVGDELRARDPRRSAVAADRGADDRLVLAAP